MKNNAIIIILLLFLAVTSFFWFQSLRIKDSPPEISSVQSTVNGKEAEAFVELAEKTIMGAQRKIQPEIYSRDPFYREQVAEQIEVAEIDPTQILTLSSIMYNDLHALAVVNGMILAEGDTIYDEKSGYDFMIESIEVNQVAVISGDKEYTLEKSREASKTR